MNNLDAQGTWVVARRRGDRVRYRNTASGAMTPWETLPALHPDTLYGQAKTRLFDALVAS